MNQDQSRDKQRVRRQALSAPDEVYATDAHPPIPRPPAST
jgi:hypothetical protein